MAGEVLFPLLKKLADTEGTHRCFGFTHLDDTALAAQPEDMVLLHEQAEHHYNNSPRKTTPFSAAFFYKAALMALTQLRGVFDTTDRQQAIS